MTLKFRPRWQRPFVRLLNWLQYGHTEARWGNKVIPANGPPRCPLCHEPVNGHYHISDDGARLYDTGEVRT